MPDETEEDPKVAALAAIIAMREGRPTDRDHYDCALDLITQMRGVGFEVRAIHA